MSIDELRDKGHGGCDTAKEAFDELCAMVDALHVCFLKFVSSKIFKKVLTHMP